MVCRQHVERPSYLVGLPGVFEVKQDRRAAVLGRNLVADQQVFVSISVEVHQHGIAFASEVHLIQEPSRTPFKAILRNLFVVIQVCMCRPVRVEGPAKDANQEIQVSVAVDIPKGGGVVSTGLEWIGGWKGLRLTPHVGGAAGAHVFDAKQTGFEEIAPEQVIVPVSVGVGKRHRVGAVQISISYPGDSAPPLRGVSSRTCVWTPLFHPGVWGGTISA